MADERIIAVDLSGPSTGWRPVPREWFRRVGRDHGIGVVIVGLWTGLSRYNAAKETMANARAEGWRTGGYYVVHDRMSTEHHIDQAKLAAGAEWQHMCFLSVDVEHPGPVSFNTVQHSFDLVRGSGQRPILYTSSYMWTSLLGSQRIPKDWPIWNAYYDGDPDFDFAKAPYGGATVEQVVGEQFTNTTGLDGQSVDFNSFRRAFIEQEEPMTAQEKAEIEARFAGVGTLLHAAFGQINEVRDRTNGAVCGLQRVQAGLTGLAERVDNTIGGNPGQVAATRQAITELQSITEKLIADRAGDAESLHNIMARIEEAGF